MALKARLLKRTVLYYFLTHVEGAKSTDVKKYGCGCDICHGGKGILKNILARTQYFKLKIRGNRCVRVKLLPYSH